MTKSDPWYTHAILYTVIVILAALLIKVAIIDPKEEVAQEKYNKAESRLRMKNLKEAQVLWEKKFGSFTGSLDSLVNFIKNDPMVQKVRTGYDSLSRRSTDPFVKLTHGEFTPDSLSRTPESWQFYLLQIDTSEQVDTVVNRQGKVLRVEKHTVIGKRYFIEDPDGYGTVGSLNDDALKNTSSWE
ncbi:MAG TPA: hypothetical protein VIH28_05105 [Ignavibacteriaceae bacterium]